MSYIKKNKKLICKYIYILISNILIYFFSNYYLRNINNKEIILLFIILIVDFIIYYYKDTVKFKYYLDFIHGLFITIILLFFIKNEYLFLINIFSINFSNNILFMRSRYNENIIKRTMQYIWILLSTLLLMLIGIVLYRFLR